MVAGLDGSLAGVRLGVPRAYFFDAPDLNPEVRNAVLTAIDQLAAAGATIVDVVIPHAALARVANTVISRSEAYAYHEPDLQSRPELYGKYIRQSLRQGAFYTAADYIQAQRVRALIKAECAQALTDVDLPITPTSINTAPKFEGHNPDAMLTPVRYGEPAIIFPATTAR